MSAKRKIAMKESRIAEKWAAKKHFTIIDNWSMDE